MVVKDSLNNTPKKFADKIKSIVSYSKWFQVPAEGPIMYLHATVVKHDTFCFPLHLVALDRLGNMAFDGAEFNVSVAAEQ